MHQASNSSLFSLSVHQVSHSLCFVRQELPGTSSQHNSIKNIDVSGRKWTKVYGTGRENGRKWTELVGKGRENGRKWAEMLKVGGSEQENGRKGPTTPESSRPQRNKKGIRIATCLTEGPGKFPPKLCILISIEHQASNASSVACFVNQASNSWFIALLVRQASNLLRACVHASRVEFVICIALLVHQASHSYSCTTCRCIKRLADLPHLDLLVTELIKLQI
jgi:hypothetical protein